jgi:hypothetical protein
MRASVSRHSLLSLLVLAPYFLRPRAISKGNGAARSLLLCGAEKSNAKAHFAVYKIEILPAIDQTLDFERGFPVSREGASDFILDSQHLPKNNFRPRLRILFFASTTL